MEEFKSLAQINPACIKASIAGPSLTDEVTLVPELRHTWACPEHQWQGPLEVCFHEKPAS